MTSTLSHWAMLSDIANHLWQSTLVAAGAGLLMLLFSRSDARARYWMALAASLKFLVPVALLVALGGQVPWPVAISGPSPHAAALTVQAISQPFALADIVTTSVDTAPRSPARAEAIPPLLLGLWACGAAAILTSRWARWRKVAAIVRQAQPLHSKRVVGAWRRFEIRSGRPNSIPVLRADTLLEPCVVGGFRPVLLWPERLADRLTDAQIEAVLWHELCHVRSRHNLASGCHMVVETIFWFHPLVWWIGKRLVQERERVCDEAVVRNGSAPETYAEGILRVCEFCRESPLACLAGITGSPLVARIEAIMMNKIPKKWGRFGSLFFAAAALVLLAGPVAAGAIRANGHDLPLAAVIANATVPIQATPMVTPGVPKPAPPISTLVTPTAASRNSPVPTGQTPAQAASGTISGTVTDQTGATISGATVTATVAGGTVARSATTNASGQFILRDLAPGLHEVRIEQDGFRRVTQRVDVGSGSSLIINASMQVGAVTEMIRITFNRAPLSATPGVEVAAQSDAQLLDLIARQPEVPSHFLQLARLYYVQERFADSDRVIQQAVDLLGRQAAARRPVTPPPGSPGGDIKPPRKVQDVIPVYPSAARAAQASGLVLLEATVSEAGTVKDAKVVQGAPSLHEAALGAVRQWLYTPTLLNGVPVEVRMTVSIDFTAR